MFSSKKRTRKHVFGVYASLRPIQNISGAVPDVSEIGGMDGAIRHRSPRPARAPSSRWPQHESAVRYALRPPQSSRARETPPRPPQQLRDIASFQSERRSRKLSPITSLPSVVKTPVSNRLKNCRQSRDNAYLPHNLKPQFLYCFPIRTRLHSTPRQILKRYFCCASLTIIISNVGHLQSLGSNPVSTIAYVFQKYLKALFRSRRLTKLRGMADISK